MESGQTQVGQQEPGTARTAPELISFRVVIDFQFRPGKGEDAPPIFGLWSDTNGVIGVFDGLGGAGGETITDEDGQERTGAWIASRLVRETVWQNAYLAQGRNAPGPSGAVGRDETTAELAVIPPSPHFTSELKRRIDEALTARAAKMRRGESSRLKSRLIKTLPTTMAIAVFDLAANEATAIWAGDSRVYQLRPEADVGLMQATEDDLKSKADALQNLTEDSPMSNCISADTNYVLHERRLSLNPRTILLAASDGCFGYVQTPLHFEYLLLSTMQDAVDWVTWQERLRTAIKAITGDDATLAAIAIGWPDFAACQRDFADRYQWCADRVGDHDKHASKIAQLQRDLDAARQDLADGRQHLWDQYRKSYESLSRLPVKDFPDKHAPAPSVPPPAGGPAPSPPGGGPATAGPGPSGPGGPGPDGPGPDGPGPDGPGPGGEHPYEHSGERERGPGKHAATTSGPPVQPPERFGAPSQHDQTPDGGSR